MSVCILLVSITACGKSEAPASITENVGDIQNTPPVAQPASSIPEIVPQDKNNTAQDEAQTLLIQNGLALAQKNNCLGCHTLDKKLVGPAWRDVAKKYKGVPNIEHQLIVKVSTGSVGSWGDMPMPAMAPAVKEEDIRALVKFVLSLE